MRTSYFNSKKPSNNGDGSDDEDGSDCEFEWYREYVEEDISSELEFDSEDEDVDQKNVRKKVVGQMFNPNTSMAEVGFQKGMIFNSWREFKWAVKDYSIAKNYALFYNIDDDIRKDVRCKGIPIEGEEPCQWRIWCSKITGEQQVQIRIYNDVHVCKSQLRKTCGGAKWLCDKIISIVRLNNKIRSKEIVSWVVGRFGMKVTPNQAYRARLEAKALIEVDLAIQYARLKDYGIELKRTNPGSTMIFQSAREQLGDPNVFKRVYICLEGLKTGFMNGCNPFIGLDGCFLKTSCGGKLLTDMGHDGNNGIFPIAWAVVESESEDSWDWFLSILMDDLGGWERRHGFTFMSDQQKGLIAAFQKHFEGVEHRFCVRHLYANYRKDYPGEMMRNQFWKCVYALTIPQLDYEMENLAKLSAQAVEKLMETNPRLRSRAYFTNDSKNFSLTNNISESYNSKIRLYREENIITMLEELKMEAMRRITYNRWKMEKHTCSLVPRVILKIKSDLELARGSKVSWSGDIQVQIFEVHRPPEKHYVNIQLKTCSCRFWELTGISCVHAIAAIGFNNLPVDDYVDAYYTKEAYLRTYSEAIQFLA